MSLSRCAIRRHFDSAPRRARTEAGRAQEARPKIRKTSATERMHNSFLSGCATQHPAQGAQAQAALGAQQPRAGRAQLRVRGGQHGTWTVFCTILQTRTSTCFSTQRGT